VLFVDEKFRYIVFLTKFGEVDVISIEALVCFYFLRPIGELHSLDFGRFDLGYGEEFPFGPRFVCG
jgi:hypothetical protein